MENQQQQPQNTPLCRANCGFYGSPATEDLCSKCFKDMIKRNQETGATNQSRHTTLENPESTSTASTSVTTTGVTGATGTVGVVQPPERAHICHQTVNQSNNQAITENKTDSSNQPNAIATTTEASKTEQGKDDILKKPKNRCQLCNKRVGLTGFECRCGGVFCGEHRYDTAHNCTFDYKATGREELRKSNPQVVTDKIQRI